MLSGCAKDIVATAEPVCAAITVVCRSSADELTEETATVILRNNEAGRAICGDPWAACVQKKELKRRFFAPKRGPQSKPKAKPQSEALVI